MTYPDYLFGKPIDWQPKQDGLEVSSPFPIKFKSLSDYVLLTIKSSQGTLTLTFAELESLYNQARKMLKLD